MRRILAVLMAAAIMATPVFSEKMDLSSYVETVPFGDIRNADTEIAPDISIYDFPDKDSLLGYMFLLAYYGLMQHEGQGGLLAYTADGDWITSWRMADTTPEDFLVNLPKSTLIAPYPLPTTVAESFFLGLGDIASARLLRGLPPEEDCVVLIAVWKIYDEVVLTDPVYALAKKGIDQRISAHGLDPEAFYADYEEATGIGEMDFIAGLMETKGNADRAIEEGMSLIAEHNRVEEQPTLFYILLGAAGLLGVVLGVVLIVIASVNRKADGYNDIEGAEDDYTEAPQGDSIGKDREDEMDRSRTPRL